MNPFLAGMLTGAASIVALTAATLFIYYVTKFIYFVTNEIAEERRQEHLEGSATDSRRQP